MLLVGRDDGDPLFLQIKEAQPSVLEPLLRRSPFATHGQRVVVGQRLMQAASDIFLSWVHSDEELDGGAHDYYVRQLWDWKTSVEVETILREASLRMPLHAAGHSHVRMRAQATESQLPRTWERATDSIAQSPSSPRGTPISTSETIEALSRQSPRAASTALEGV